MPLDCDVKTSIDERYSYKLKTFEKRKLN